MKHNINHVVDSYYIGDKQVTASVTYGREGVKVEVDLDMEPGQFVTLDGMFHEERLVTWDEIEAADPRFTHPSGYVAGVAQELARKAVRAALPLKQPGVVYCDGGS